MTNKIGSIVFVLFVSSVSCFAVEVLRVLDVDLKDHVTGDRLVTTGGVELTDKQCQYACAMDRIVQGAWQKTELKAGDDWRKLWSERAENYVKQVPETERDSLRKALEVARKIRGEYVTLILEGVIKAKSDGQDVWIFLMHWEIEVAVENALATKGVWSRHHSCALALRCSDQVLVTFSTCG